MFCMPKCCSGQPGGLSHQATLKPKLKMAWGVRASDMDLTRYDWFSRFTYSLERRFSRYPKLIIANSAAGRRYAVSHGFPDGDHFIVIPNGD